MPKKIDLVGKKFGRYSVLGISHRFNGHIYWNCTCDCGEERTVNGNSLRRGISKSCGCLNSEVARDRMQTHGISRSRIYRIYHGMIARCYKETSSRYPYYGERGISVEERWKGNDGLFNFLSDMEPTYEDGLTLERKDVNGSYSRENCTWIGRKAQSRNTRRNVFVDSPWGKICLSEVVERSKIGTSVFRHRMKNWPQDRWFDPPGARLKWRT